MIVEEVDIPKSITKIRTCVRVRAKTEQPVEVDAGEERRPIGGEAPAGRVPAKPVYRDLPRLDPRQLHQRDLPLHFRLVLVEEREVGDQPLPLGGTTSAAEHRR